MKHIHAELMMQYAQDAMENDKPWLFWESKDNRNGEWKTRADNPCWYENIQYRRKQKTININGFEVPEPLINPPVKGTLICVASTACTGSPVIMSWVGNDIDNVWLKNGILHLTAENAQKHIDALLSFTRKDK